VFKRGEAPLSQILLTPLPRGDKGGGLSKILEEKKVVTCFLESDGELLILRRSEKVGSYQGRWAGVSGYVETTPDEQALVEIEEEVGLSGDDLQLVKKGEPLSVEDAGLGVRWLVHPYLFHISNRDKVRIDWEHKEARWIKPQKIVNFQTVPMLKETLAQVW
jgi:8-oxo-dGTP diphosphatase